ncbi:MAG: sugar transferase [Caloramator sp.]|nr:sugar transferase [Caloramator sp.]
MKRFLDILLSLICFILFSPFFIIICIAIKLDSKGSIFFTQRRIGKNNKEFILYKFRTMKVGTPEVATHLLKNPDAYITRVGKILRKTSLDEVPQLLNIIKGEMAIVGPRPALYNQYDLIELRTAKGVHTLLPGVTGWAQINGRDALSIEEKVKYDEYYLQNYSILFDIKILFLTVFKVLRAEGVIEGAVNDTSDAKSQEGISL